MTTESVTSILDAFEDAWCAGRIPRVGDFLLKLKTLNDRDAELAICSADLEWRWKTFYQMGDLSECFGADAYVQLYPELFSVRSSFESIIQAEWLTRSRWGDSPTVDEFLFDESRSKTGAVWSNTENFRLALVRSLDDIATLVASVGHRGEQFQFICPPEYEIGRRRKHDPLSIAWVESQNRLVIAEDSELTVSRRQLVVRRIRLNEVELANVSRKVTVAIGQEQLGPGERARIETPFSIQLLDVRIAVKANCNAFN